MGLLDVVMYIFWAWTALVHFDEWWIKRKVRNQEELIKKADYDGTLPLDHPYYGFDGDAQLRKVTINGLLVDVKNLKEKVRGLEVYIESMRDK